ncbi:MAG: hypothetical protein JEZ05_01225 [Tenericutes bacterium]|nr:hypothetical protein [Mycoplasmatota bacterium]
MFLNWFTDYGVSYLLTTLVLVWTVISFFLLQKNTSKNNKDIEEIKLKSEIVKYNHEKQYEAYQNIIKTAQTQTEYNEKLSNIHHYNFEKLIKREDGIIKQLDKTLKEAFDFHNEFVKVVELSQSIFPPQYYSKLIKYATEHMKVIASSLLLYSLYGSDKIKSKEDNEYIENLELFNKKIENCNEQRIELNILFLTIKGRTIFD